MSASLQIKEAFCSRVLQVTLGCVSTPPPSCPSKEALLQSGQFFQMPHAELTAIQAQKRPSHGLTSCPPSDSLVPHPSLRVVLLEGLHNVLLPFFSPYLLLPPCLAQPGLPGPFFQRRVICLSLFFLFYFFKKYLNILSFNRPPKIQSYWTLKSLFFYTELLLHLAESSYDL